MPLALHDGTPEQVAEKTFTKQYTRQILWNRKTISKRMMPANPVCGTNIKAPEPAVKDAPGRKCVQ